MHTALPTTLAHWRAVAAAAATCLLAALIGPGTPATAGAGLSCDHVASATGSDANPGTEAQPFSTPAKLVGALRSGETGCFRGGTYDFTSERLKMERPDVTLTSYPGEQGKLVGRLWVASGADGVTVSNLKLRGQNSSNLPSPTINAHDTVWHDNNVSNRHAPTICFHLGSGTYGNANRTLIKNNRIHDCGKLPATNHHHGIYILHSNDSVIRGNMIYGNADRGVQFYPNAKRTRVVDNVIHGNGEGVMFGGEGSYASSDNVVARNVIAKSKIRHNIESYWGGRVGEGNVAHDNCLYAKNKRSSYYNSSGGVSANSVGYKAFDNLVARPRYVDRAAKDFRLRPDSRCYDALRK